MLFRSLLTPEIGIAFTAIFISLLWFRRKLGKAKEAYAEKENAVATEAASDEETKENFTSKNGANYLHLSESEETEHVNERNDDVYLKAPIVKTLEEDLDDTFEQPPSENGDVQEEPKKVQESNISEILDQSQFEDSHEGKDEKKDSAFETSESEAETRDPPRRYQNEIASVTELPLEVPLEQTVYKTVDHHSPIFTGAEKLNGQLLHAVDGTRDTKRDSGTISPSLSVELLEREAKSARYDEADGTKLPVSLKKSNEKIDQKLKETLEQMFDDDDDLALSEDEDEMRGAVRPATLLSDFDHKPSANPPLIVDLGSMWTRIGMSSEQDPTIVQRTMIGELRKTLTNKQQTYYGQDVVSRSGILTRREPAMGEQVNWSDVCDLIEHFTTNKFNIDLADQPITLSANHDKKSRRGAVQQLFEGRHTPGVHLTSQAACALFGAGYTSGIVAHGGHRGIEVIPVYEGAQLHHARTVTRGGGEQMTENLRVYMRDECATPMNTFSEVDYLRLVCERHASFYRPEFCPRPAKRKTEFELPDGNTVNFQDGIRRCTENILPSSDVYEKILSRCDRDLLNAGVFSTCIMSGGMSNIENYSNCIKGDLQVALHSVRKQRNLWETSETLPYRELNTITSDDGAVLSWRGASAISSTSNFSQTTITKELYAEFGDSIVDRFH